MFLQPGSSLHIPSEQRMAAFGKRSSGAKSTTITKNVLMYTFSWTFSGKVTEDYFMSDPFVDSLRKYTMFLVVTIKK